MPKRGPGRPTRGGYRLEDGTIVPSVTTILGRFKESGGLIQWAYQQGQDGVPLYEKRDRAGGIGSVVHDLAEERIHGGDVDKLSGELCADMGSDSEEWKAVCNGYKAFEKWFTSANVEVVETETPYVSEIMKFGGTLDAVGRFDGELCILDWKTSKAIYTDYLLQVAAYKLLWQEANPEPGISGFHVCRFNKHSGGFAHHYYPDLKEAEEMFVCLLKAYRLDKKLKDIL